MKDIYEDGHSVPGNEKFSQEFSGDPLPGIVSDEEFASHKLRRQYRSSEEKRAKRAERIEESTARRAAGRARGDGLPQQPEPPAAPAEQPTFVPIVPQYYIQQTPGQPPQLVLSPQTAVQPGQQTFQPAVNDNRLRGNQAAHTQGMKIVYQSPDFDMPAKSEAGRYDSFASPEEKNSKPAYRAYPAPSAGVGAAAAARPQRQTLSGELRKTADRNLKKTDEFFVNDMKVDFRETQSKKPSDSASKAVSASAGIKVTEEKLPPEPEKKLSGFEIARRIILCVSIIVAVGALTYLGYEWKLSHDNSVIEQEMAELAELEGLDEPDTTEEVATSKKEEAGNEVKETTTKKAPTTTTKALTPEEEFASIRAANPSIVYPNGMQARFARYYTINQDFVGYLTIDGLKVSLPIVQTSDEDADNKYLDMSFYQKKTKYGCPFVSYQNNIAALDRNTTIFGHHMKNGTIFAPITKYTNIKNYKKAPVITFNTLYADYKWKVIAVIITNAYAADDNGYLFYYNFTNLSTDENFQDYIEALKVRSLYDTGVDVLPTDKLLTLSTCSYQFDNARTVVVARMVRPGESTYVDTSKAVANSNPRYPQAYYDKKGKTNPFDTTYNWMAQ